MLTFNRPIKYHIIKIKARQLHFYSTCYSKMCMSRNHTKWVVLTCGLFPEKGKQAIEKVPLYSQN